MDPKNLHKFSQNAGRKRGRRIRRHRRQRRGSYTSIFLKETIEVKNDSWKLYHVIYTLRK